MNKIYKIADNDSIFLYLYLFIIFLILSFSFYIEDKELFQIIFQILEISFFVVVLIILTIRIIMLKKKEKMKSSQIRTYKHIRTNKYVEAVQWNGQIIPEKWLPKKSYVFDEDGRLFVAGEAYQYEVNLGDYIVKDGRGLFFALPEQEFLENIW